MKDFRSLDVWKKSHELVLAVYKVSAGFPSGDLYVFSIESSKLRRYRIHSSAIKR